MEFDQTYIERRRKTFAVKVAPARDPVAPGELAVEFTHNGFQWSVLTLTPEEAATLIGALLAAMPLNVGN